MTTYKCKCGRLVSKSTNADNTGNRDVSGCDGCPYLMPYGQYEYIDGEGYVMKPQGNECRMSRDLEYASRFGGSITDKCSCYIASLDFDFLARVSDWILETYPGGELHGRFSVPDIRPVEYSSNGRYRMSITCAQNKKGVAAKAELLHQFFDDSGARLDMTPEEEKAHVLAAIEAGKAKGQEKGEKKKQMTYKDPWNGWLYRVSPEPDEDDLYHIEYRDPTSSAMFKLWPPMGSAGCTMPESLEEVLAARAKKNGWVDADAPELAEENAELSPCNDCRCPECGDPDCPQAHCDKSDNGFGCFAPNEECPPENRAQSDASGCSCAGCKTPDCTCAGMKDASGREECDGHQNCAQNGCSYAAKRREPMPETPASVSTPDVPETAPAGFDYSGLDAQTVADLHLAEREYAGGKKMAEMGLRRMADAVAIAHDALCGACDKLSQAHNNQYSKDTFGAWCDSVGIHRKAAERLLQVSKLMDSSTPREQKVLEELSPSLLYSAAKPSAPAELVQAVKDGDITTNKQYQEALAQLKAEREARAEADRRADAAEQRAREVERARNAAEGKAASAASSARAAEAQAKEATARIAALEKEREQHVQWLMDYQDQVDGLRDELCSRKPQQVEAQVVDQDELQRMAELAAVARVIESARESVEAILKRSLEAVTEVSPDIYQAIQALTSTLADYYNAAYDVIEPPAEDAQDGEEAVQDDA